MSPSTRCEPAGLFSLLGEHRPLVVATSSISPLTHTTNGGKFCIMIRYCWTWDGPIFSVPVSPSELRKVLKGLGLSQSEASRRLYVSVNTVQRWVSGARKIPGPVIAALEAWQRQAKAEEALKRVKEALDR